MTLLGDIVVLGWPLWLGLPVLGAWAAHLAEQRTDARGVLPSPVQRAQLFFAEGDVLRALVLLEGEPHPLCRMLSDFWKGIPTPRQWEGIALIAEYQRQQGYLLARHQQPVRQFAFIGLGLLLVQAIWLGVHAGGVPTGPDWWGSAAAGVTVVAVGTLLWMLQVLNRCAKRQQWLQQLMDRVIYESIEALDRSRHLAGPDGARAMAPPPPGNRPRNIVSQAYKG